MKVVLLSDPASAHTIKWANGIHSKGVNVMVYGLTSCDYSQYNSGIEFEVFKIPEFFKWQNDGNILKSVLPFKFTSIKKNY